ncbi:sugar ABC transporter permease [Halostella sp. JP-L12]|uniref:carbohydrate ABC transporter permease n=1 Tax=Halostella TaxID=1843185 RepID=UPI0013CEC726|nr:MULTISPECIES: sugar ABC transporter permease [Halostella]NHN49355.1 sugar ABC transporter permease [Halostella sp. JP-L12]
MPDGIRERWIESDRLLGATFLFPVVALVVFVVFLPVAWALYNSLFAMGTLSLDQEFIWFQNYEALLFGDAGFWDSLGRSLYFALGSTFLQLLLAIPTALLLNKQLKGIALARAVALLPYLIPTIVVGMVFTWMGHPQLGVMSNLAQDTGLANDPVSFFGSETWAMPSLIVANSWKFTAFIVMMVLARLQSIPETHYEAARMCGANAWEQFRDVTLPNIRSVILLVLLLRGIWMFNKFDIIWILTRGGPAEATTTLPIFIYEIAFVEYRMGLALAASTLLFFLLVLGGIAYMRIFNPAEEVAT